MSKQTAVGYTRLSQTSDTSIEDQKREIRELADEQDFELTNIYDDGQRSSGFDTDRPEYLEMQAALEAGEADAIIVRDRDRLSRDKRERSMFYYDLDEWGAELWTIKDRSRVELGDDESWLIEMIRNYMDDVQKRREIQQARKKINERVENGYWQGRPRFGTEHDDDGKYLVPGDEFDTALEVIARIESGEAKLRVAEETAVPRSTVYTILDNREWYRDLAAEHEVELPDFPTSVNA